MTNHDKQYYIYLRSSHERIPCTKEDFDAYYHDIDLFRQRQEYRNLCACPKRSRLDCDMDCITCPFHKCNALSLDATKTNPDGEETPWIDTVPNQAPNFSDTLINKEGLMDLFKRLNEIMPQAITIGHLREQGMSDTAIANEIGIPRKTFTDRIKKALDILKKEFPEFF